MFRGEPHLIVRKRIAFEPERLKGRNVAGKSPVIEGQDPEGFAHGSSAVVARDPVVFDRFSIGKKPLDLTGTSSFRRASPLANHVLAVFLRSAHQTMPGNA